ncbi:MAG: MFS transporter, partial [Propionibacteriaceae bacterium]
MTDILLPPTPERVADTLPPVDKKNLRRAAWAGGIGTALENFDFTIYGTASAIIFSKIFFSNLDPAVGIIASFGALFVGFGARPLGGLFFSKFGDRLGRKFVMVATLFLMGTATFAIGLLPTYAVAGIWSPILLVACRFLQGFGAGA